MVTQPQGTYVDVHDQRLTSQIDPELHPDHTSPKKNVKVEIIRKLPTFVHLVNAGAFRFLPGSYSRQFKGKNGYYHNMAGSIMIICPWRLTTKSKNEKSFPRLCRVLSTCL